MSNYVIEIERKTPLIYSTDVVVVGGGPAGVAAAIAAAAAPPAYANYCQPLL